MTLLDWPDVLPIFKQQYRTPDGLLPRVTTILKVVGTGKEFLMSWAAEMERRAALDAAAEVFAAGKADSPAVFAMQLEEHLGVARKHVKAVDEAADIGTQAHRMVQWQMISELGLDAGPMPELDERALWAYMSFQDYWKDSGLKVVRVEQSIWEPEIGYAGTIDVVAEDKNGIQGIIDLKTSKYLYDTHHLQVMAYLHAGRRFADLKWAKLVRLPKRTDDPKFEVRDLGHLKDRTLTEEQLMAVFKGAVTIYNALVSK